MPESYAPGNVRRHTWGWSFRLHWGPREELWLARGRAGGASSYHYHEAKSNVFIVASGEVELWSAGEVVICKPGASYLMRPFIPHRMVFRTDAELYEFYVVEPGELLDPGDIVRMRDGWAPGKGPDRYEGELEAMIEAAKKPAEDEELSDL